MIPAGWAVDMNTPTFCATDLQQLQLELNTWRQGRSGRAHLPEALWAAATQLAQAQGVSRVSRALRLGYFQLQRRVQAAASAPPPGFVELPRLLPPAPTERSGLVEQPLSPVTLDQTPTSICWRWCATRPQWPCTQGLGCRGAIRRTPRPLDHGNSAGYPSPLPRSPTIG